MTGQGHVKRYSEAYKLHVIKDMEEHALTNAETVKKYGLSNSCLLHQWLKKYGKYQLLKRIVRIEMPSSKSPYDEIKELKAEKQKLETALAQSHMKNLVLESMIEIAEEKYQLSIKKKHGTKPLKERGLKNLKQRLINYVKP
jgi:transposase